MNTLGLYIHIPWCVQKCPYCDFNSHAVKSTTPERQYIDTLLSDLQQDAALLSSPSIISSIFIGGGTPSLFSADSFERLFAGISAIIPLQNNVEITLEANPGTFESNKFAKYRAIGINRLSIGVQSFNDAHLKILGRIHSSKEATKAIKIAQDVDFDNINIDLMFGLPTQSATEMQYDIKTALALHPSHLSFYQLTLEPNTYFYKFPPTLPESDAIFSAQLQCQQLLSDSGYQQYEISAYAKSDKKCQHNNNYWQFGDYLGIGAGAHGKLTLAQPENIIRTTKAKSPADYLTNNRAAIKQIAISELPIEYLMNQLRLKAGFNLTHYQHSTGLSPKTLQQALNQCVFENLLIKDKNHYYCSEKGWHFLDNILEKFIH